MTGKPHIDEVLRDFSRDVEDLRMAICRSIYADLQVQYEYLMSDEHLVEASFSNDWYFDDCGNFET